MIELSVRLLAAGALLFCAGAFRIADFDVAWKVSLAIAAVAGLSHRLEQKGLKSPVAVGAMAVVDSFLIATILASNGRLETIGFLALAPCIIATNQAGPRSAIFAPFSGFAIVLADQGLRGGTHITNGVMLQAAAVLILGFVLAASQRPEPVEPDETTIVLAGTDYRAEVDEDTNVLVLRERFRRLRDAYDDLEGRTQKYKVLASLAEAQATPDGARIHRVMARLLEATGIQGMVLYGPAEYGRLLTLRAAHGNVPESIKNETLTLDHTLSQAAMNRKFQIDLQEAMAGLPFETVTLVHQGKVAGLLAMIHEDATVLEAARRTAEASSLQIAALVSESFQKKESERRMREAELLYSLASLARGAESALDTAARFARELREILGADHAGVFLIEEQMPLALAQDGTEMRVIDDMSFAMGKGLKGWIGVGSPELLIFDVRADSRVTGEAIRRQRLGSFFLVPFSSGSMNGFVTVATIQVGGLDLGAAETTRIVSAELGRALSRNEASIGEGIMTPAEFQDRVNQEAGALVVFETLRREQLESQFGRLVVQNALRTFLRRIGSRLPSGACVSRNDEGQLLVFLPDTEEAFAGAWANEMAAVASMIGVRAPSGNTRIPFAVRARVATFNPQNSRFSDRMTA